MFRRKLSIAGLCLAAAGSLVTAATFCHAAPLALKAPLGPLASGAPLLFQASFDNTLDAIGAGGALKPTWTEGKIEYRAGRSGSALLAGGDGALIKYPVAGNIRATEGTLAMWVQPVDWPADEQAFHVFFETEGPGWLLLYKFNTGGVLTLAGIDKSHYNSAFDEQFNLQNGRWYHLVSTWSKGSLALYIDGVLLKEVPQPPLPKSLKGSFILGDAPWSTPHASHTLIDEVKIYRYALPAAQVARMAKGESVEYSPGLPISVEPHPAFHRWNVTVDAGAYVSAGDKASADVEIVKTGAATMKAKGRIEKFVDGSGTARVDVAKLAPGNYTVRASVLDAAGKKLANNSIAFHKPANAPWIDNKIGLQDKVLPPYTAIKVGGRKASETQSAVSPKLTAKTIECWNRKYDLEGPFPTQIESGGQPLLATPIHLSMTTGAGEQRFEKPTSTITNWSDTRANARGTATSADFHLKTQSSLEYDGMMWTEMTLTPKKAAMVNGLTLCIPLRATGAKYIHHTAVNFSDNDAGALPPTGYETSAVQPYIWLGDEEHGLAWFTETQQGWSNAAGKVLQRVVRQGAINELQILFINQPTRVNAPIRISFGLQATPVRPRAAEWRRWRLRDVGNADDLKANDPDNLGNIQIIWPNGNMAHYGYPWPKDAASFHRAVATLHAKNIKVVPYVNLNYMQTEAPEWKYYSPDFVDSTRSFVGGDVGQMGAPTLGACPHSAAWRDFIAYKIAKFVDEFDVDGIYVDCWFPFNCLVESHGCGWRDANGNLRPRFPIRDYREIMRRVREIFADRRPDFHIIAHMSSSVCIPALAFADSMLDGEQYRDHRTPGDDYLNVIPLEKWRSEHSGYPWGIHPFFLPEFAGDYRTAKLPSERLMAIMLAHDISPWPIWSNASVIHDAWRTVDKFGIVNAEFLPYWKPNGITTDNKEVVVSAYRKPQSALLVVFNTGKTDAITKVTVNTGPLKIKARGKLKAQSLADDTPLDLTDNRFEVTVPARSYRLVVVK